MIAVQAQILYPGAASGTALRLEAPISFWGGVDPATSRITQGGHPQRGLSIAGTMLVIPRLIGSSSSCAILLELIHAKRAPRALILGHGDAILPIAAVIAEQMGWPCPPLFVAQTDAMQTGQSLTITTNGQIGITAPNP